MQYNLLSCRYEEVHHYDQDIQSAMASNDFELALQILQAAKDKFAVIQEDAEISRWATENL